MSARLQVHLTPRSSKNKLQVQSDGSLKAWVTASPTNGQANQALCELIAKSLEMAKGRVDLVKGRASRTKTVEVIGLTLEQCLAKLGAQ
jgi:uncharacterized protein